MPITQLGGFGRPLRTLLSWAQTLGVDWEDSLDETVDFLRKRLRGDYAVDEFGFDPEFTTKIFCRRCGGSLIPGSGSRSGGGEPSADGSALLVSNHAGTLPIDGMIMHTVVYDEIGRHVRMLGRT